MRICGAVTPQRPDQAVHVVVGEARIPSFEQGPERAVERAGARLRQKVGAAARDAISTSDIGSRPAESLAPQCRTIGVSPRQSTIRFVVLPSSRTKGGGLDIGKPWKT